MAFFSLEPFGPQAVNFNAGIIAATIANANRGKDSKPFEVTDFSQGNFDEYKEDIEDLSVEEQVKALAVALGAKVVKRKRKKGGA